MRGPRPKSAKWPLAASHSGATRPQTAKGGATSAPHAPVDGRRGFQNGVANPTCQEGRGFPPDEVMANARTRVSKVEAAIDAVGESDPTCATLREALARAKSQAQERPVANRIKHTNIELEKAKKKGRVSDDFGRFRNRSAGAQSDSAGCIERGRPAVGVRSESQTRTITSTIPSSEACPANRFFLLTENSEEEVQEGEAPTSDTDNLKPPLSRPLRLHWNPKFPITDQDRFIQKTPISRQRHSPINVLLMWAAAGLETSTQFGTGCARSQQGFLTSISTRALCQPTWQCAAGVEGSDETLGRWAII